MDKQEKKCKNKRSSAILVLYPALAACTFAVISYAVFMWEVARLETSQRLQLIEMTNSFVSVFSENRGNDTPVPATFRRMGIEHFTESAIIDDQDVRTTVRMPGTPGLAIRTRATDPSIMAAIDDFIEAEHPTAFNEHVFLDGALIGRSISPSIADNQSCVSCHNAILEQDVYEVGDIMGAFVVESDLTNAAWRNLFFAACVLFVGFFAFRVLSRRERNRTEAVINGLEASVKLEKEKVVAETHAKFLSSHDSLTGLANRAMFLERLESELKRTRGAGVTIALIDIDNFKLVNDALGHGTGDMLLGDVAKRLRSILGSGTDLVARLGGDEFAMITNSNSNFTTPCALGDAINAVMRPTFVCDSAEIPPSCSVGILEIDDTDLERVSDLMKAVDAALYTAKANGKGNYAVFDETVRASLGRRTSIAVGLRQAIEDESLNFALQPKVNMVSGCVVGMEALARLRIEDEDISPAEFIPIAEDVGLIRSVDLFILRQAAHFLVGAQVGTKDVIPLSVNISALNFRSAGLVEQIVEILDQTRLKPEDLTIEITESAAVEAWREVKEVMNELRMLGVKVSLDDFGAGYSSLSYLHEFGFDEIKIDRSFIAKISEDAEARFLLESIIRLVGGLGSEIVIEGVETIEQVDAVVANGAIIGQGYFYERPLTCDMARAYIAKQGVQAA